MLWNEPNNKSHWAFEEDPEWAAFARDDHPRGRCDRGREPGPRQGAGRHLADRSRSSSANMAGKGVLDHLDAVAVHGFPLDWNHWQLNDWPEKLREIQAVTEPAGLGFRGRRLDLRRRGGAGLRAQAHGRAAVGPQPRASTGTASTTCRAPGRPPPATRRPRARPTTATSTWASCARTARPSWRCRTSASSTPELGICQWFHFEDHRLDEAVRWLRELGVTPPAHRPELGRLLPAGRACLVRPADGGARGVPGHGHLLLHAGA